MRKFAALLLLPIVCGAAAVADEKKTDYYPLKSGAKWHYRVQVGGQERKIVFHLAKIETIDGQRLGRLETVADGRVVASEHLTSTAKGVFRYRYNGVEVAPPLCLLKYPVKDGDSWDSAFTVGTEKATATCRVGREEIEVPAGKFKAVTVSVTADAANMKVSTTYWFVAGMGVVKQTADIGGNAITLELEKLEKGK
ncbi:MAG: hypothetical protein FJ271_04935 [Planctomycetes bacterium]|nr:hypothetical protein [Planctomycetota bacterium]